MTQQKFTDEQLTAFIDDELDRRTCEAITLALEYDAELRRRIEDLSIDINQIKNTFDRLLECAPEANEHIIGQTPSRTRKFIFSQLAYIQVAGACLCIAIGWWLNKNFDNHTIAHQWQQYAAVYHALYINSTLSHIDQDDQHSSAELHRVSQALGKNIELDAVKQLTELHYKRAQILGFEGQPLIQLAFLSGVDAPIALCIMRDKKAVTQTVEFSSIEGMSAAVWSNQGYSYLLIGGTDEALIQRTAQDLQAVL